MFGPDRDGRRPVAAMMLVGAVSGAWLPGCRSLLEDFSPDLETIDSTPLCTVETESFALHIDLDSQSAHADLETYYETRNPDFVARLTAVHDAYRDGSGVSGVTYLMGAAGVGKSFMLRNSLNAFGDDQQCEIELGKWYGRDANLLPYAVEQAPDLATLDNKTVVNRLPTHTSGFNLRSLLEVAECYVDGSLVPLVVLDGVDEIHDDAAARILEAVDDFVLDNEAEGFVHFLVSGRPEGFWSWLTDPNRTDANTAIVKRFDLAPPQYVTGGDLELRIVGFLEFSNQLDKLEQAEELDAYISSVSSTIATHPFLSYSTGNLAVGNVVIEQTAPGLNQSESELKAGLLDDILQRNSDTHGRPGDGEALEGAYRRALEEIAAHYAAEVDSEGVFTTRSEDVVPFIDDDGTVLGEVRVRDLLNRSGAAFLTSAADRTSRYHFDPFWLHGHLVERYNARKYPGYRYRTCQ